MRENAPAQNKLWGCSGTSASRRWARWPASSPPSSATMPTRRAPCPARPNLTGSSRAAHSSRRWPGRARARHRWCTWPPGRQDLAALAEDVAALASRGSSGGPKRGMSVVALRGVDRYTIQFDGGRPATVVISGDGDSKLDLYVYDADDRLICRRDGLGDDAICLWTPRWTGPFTVRVVNRGVASNYASATN